MSSPRLHPLARLTQLAVQAPRRVLWFHLILTLACLWGARGLRVRTGRLDMIPRNDVEAQRFLDFRDRFGSLHRLVVVISGEKAREAADQLAESLNQEPPVKRARARLDLDLYARQFLPSLPTADLRKLRQNLVDNRIELEAILSPGGLTRFFDRLRQSSAGRSLPSTDALDALGRVVDYLEHGSAESPPPVADLLGTKTLLPRRPHFVDPQGYFVSASRDRVMVSVESAVDTDRHKGLLQFMHAVRGHAKRISEATGVRFEYGGEPALKYEEKQAAEESLRVSSVVAVSLVTGFFAVAFYRRRLPFLAIVGLVASLIWSLAFAKAAIGSLTLVASAFIPILVGLGGDFAIHLISHYEDRRLQVPCEEAMVLAAQDVASGAFTGATTTSAGFLSMLLVGFPAFQGLGLIAGAGIMFALWETFTLLPAMALRFGGPPPSGRRQPPASHLFKVLGHQISVTPGAFFLGGLGILLVSLRPAFQVQFDTNLLALSDPNSPAMNLQDQFLEDFGFSPFLNAILFEDLEKLKQCARELEQDPVIGFVESLAPLVPNPDPEAAREIREIRKLLEALPLETPATPGFLDSRNEILDDFRKKVGLLRIGYLSESEPRKAWKAERLRQGLVRLIEAKDASLPRERTLLQELHETFRELRNSARSTPLALSELPEEYLQRFQAKGPEGRPLYALLVAPGEDVRSPEEARRFNQRVRDQAQRYQSGTTGAVILTEHMVGLLEGGYRETCLYAFLVVLLLVFVDLRCLWSTCIVLSVSVFSLVVLRAAMALHGIPLNAANFIHVPLLLGIGVDNAVHVVHSFRRDPVLPRTLREAGRPIVINAITSVFGFGALALARHVGLYSLGWTLAVGVFLATVATFLILPAFLAFERLSTRRRRRLFDAALALRS